jgi:superfamily I DNA/RNA helicase
MILTSAHRSKGLEFNQVQMADDFMDFYDEKNGVWKDFSEADATTLEEVNLQYVAATRARKVLQVGERLLAYLQMTQMRRTAPAPEPVVRRFGLLDRPLRATAVG